MKGQLNKTELVPLLSSDHTVGAQSETAVMLI